MNPALVEAAQYIQWFIFLYFLTINSTYTLLIIFALKDIVQHAYISTARGARRMLTAEAYFKPVTVIVPAYNEAAVISQSLMSLLNLHYPEFEIVVISDGSSDNTMEVLKRDFNLRPYTRPLRMQIKHAPIRDILVSADYPHLIVVDKENGGKADAINAGINVSSYPLFCSIDADSLLEPDSLIKASKLFIEDDELIATGGIVRVMNGCTVKDGAVTEIAMPHKTLEAIQVLEYTRAFLSGRTGWNMLESLLIISGAFGVFRKDIVTAVNGYRKTVGEDMDLVMRLHRHCMDNKIPYKILFVPDPVCWTQVPFELGMLRKQRNRWHRGLLDSLITNRAMILNPKYGKVSLLGVSYFTFVEVLGPIIELMGYISIPILYFAGLLNVRFLILLVIVAVLWGISINIAAIFLDTFNYRRYKKESDILRLCLISVVEFFGYRQLTLYERMRACFSFRETRWGAQARQALQPGGAPVARPVDAPDTHAAAPVAGGLARSKLALAASRFFTKLPALLLAMLALRLGELAGGLQAGATPGEVAAVLEAALLQDLLTLLRYLPLLFLLSLPLLLLRWRRAGDWGLNLAWSGILLVQAALVQYYLTARVPLGSDLLGYSLTDIVTAARGGLPFNLPTIIGTLLAFAGFSGMLAVQRKRHKPLLSPGRSSLLLGLSLLPLLFLPGRSPYDGRGSEDTYNLTLNKQSFFLDDSAAYLAGSLRGGGAEVRSAGAATAFRYLDPAYPFLRAEQTPDALGPYFKPAGAAPPNFVFILVEGLGRSFSGPGAHLGSFTPNLDRLAQEGLYWENFLAVQGRTFALMPSVFASLPFGANGVAALGRNIPPHDSFFSVLKAAGYRVKMFVGFNLDFDNDRDYMTSQGADLLVDELNFGPGYKRSNSWGYSDGDLFKRAIEEESRDRKLPFISVIKTTTMHTPYTFPEQERFYPLFERRLEELGLSEGRKASYREHRQIYSSILYTDAGIGKLIEDYKKHPAYANTVFIVTGDHRLPEIPMSSRIDRYHVPLLIFSPLLAKRERIKSISSHFDITPSLLAFLSNNYGLPTPQSVVWVGAGLDMEPSLRSVRSVPLKQTKTNLVDFVSGEWFLNQQTLYALGDGLSIEPARDPAVLARLKEEFDAFKAANDSFTRSNRLLPEGATGKLGPYNAKDRLALPAASSSAKASLSVREVFAPDTAAPGPLAVEAVFLNPGKTDSPPFIPLAVLVTENGDQAAEAYGELQSLPAGQTARLVLTLDAAALARGRYFISVFPSDPQTGKRSGSGRYRVPVRLASPVK